jgi:hypothetical protein
MQDLPGDLPLAYAYLQEAGTAIAATALPMELLAKCATAPPFESNETTADFLLFVIDQQLKKLRCAAMIRSIEAENKQRVL